MEWCSKVLDDIPSVVSRTVFADDMTGMHLAELVRGDSTKAVQNTGAVPQLLIWRNDEHQ